MTACALVCCLCMCALPRCSALCNDSSLSYQSSSGSYTRIGESTELALRVFVEKVGLNVSACPARKLSCRAWKQVLATCSSNCLSECSTQVSRPLYRMPTFFAYI
jgi:hypothetical protein